MDNLFDCQCPSSWWDNYQVSVLEAPGKGVEGPCSLWGTLKLQQKMVGVRCLTQVLVQMAQVHDLVDGELMELHCQNRKGAQYSLQELMVEEPEMVEYLVQI